MGKQIKGWVPPEDAVVETTPAQEETTSKWSPPEDAIPSAEVKKKELTSLSGSDSSRPAEQEQKPSEQNLEKKPGSLTEAQRQQLSSVNPQKTEQQSRIESLQRSAKELRTDEFIEGKKQEAPSFFDKPGEASSNFVGHFNKAVIESASSVPKTIGILANKIDKTLGLRSEPVENYATFKSGEWLEKKAADWGITATDPRRDDDFMLSTVPSALGSIAAIMLSRGSSPEAQAIEQVAQTQKQAIMKGVTEAGKQVASGAGVVGSTSMAVPEWEAAKQAGMDDDEALKVFAKNYFVGMTEILPVENALSRLDKLSGGKVTQILSAGLKGGLEEGTQEIVQQTLTNKIAEGSYDPNRDLFQDVLQSGGAGFFVGFILPGIGAAMNQMTPEQRQQTKEVLNTALKAHKNGTFTDNQDITTHEFIKQESSTVDPSNTKDIAQSADRVQAKIEASGETTEPVKEEPLNQQEDASVVQQDQGSVPQEGNTGEESQANSSGNIQQDQRRTQGDAEAQQQEGSQVEDQTEDQKLSGIKKALVSDEVVGATPIERRSTEQMLTEAKKQVDSGEVDPKAIVDEISKGKPRALQPNEVSALVYYKTQLDNRADQVNAKMVKAIEEGDTDAQAALKIQMESIQEEKANYEDMSVKTAYEQSLAFRLRQMLLNNEYNLQSQILKYKANNNGQISPQQEQRFIELDKQLKVANAKIAQMEEMGKSRESEQSLINIRQALERDRVKRKKLITVEKKTKINDFFESLKIKDVGGTANDITRVVGSAIWNGSMEVVKQSVLAGANLANAVQAGIDHIREHYKGADFDPEQFRKIVAPNLEKIIPSETEKIISEPKIKNGKLTIPKSLIRDVVEGGANTIDEVTDQIHSIVKESIPEVTEREVRDAITGYGKTVSMSKDEIDKKIREIKTLGRMVSSLEDIENKKRPLRSGLQRDKPTDEQRKLKREITEKMKDLPVDEAEVEQAWKNSLDAVKSRLKNQIADLENQIQKGEKTPKKKGVAYDQEAIELKKQRDELKSTLAEMEGPAKMSDEQRIRTAITNVQKKIAEYERRIREKDFTAKEKRTGPVSDELAALRGQRDGLKKAYTELEKEAGIADKKRLEAYKKAVKKSLENYERRIKEKDFVTPKKEEANVDEEAKKLRFERDKIKEQFQVEQEKNRLKNRPFSEKAWDTTVDVLNLPKSLLASIDMSAPMRQGLILSAGNPVVAGKSTVEMFRQAFSQERAEKWLHDVKESEIYPLIRQSKLYLAEPNTKLTAKEEQFLSKLAKYIPIIGESIKGKALGINVKVPGLGLISKSERAYTGYLNKLRLDVFANGVDRLQEQKITIENNPEAYKAWANFINNATGRGDLGLQSLENASGVLNAFFFSPRFVASRVNVLNPVKYAKMPASVRRMAMKNMAAYIGFYGVVALMAAAAGAEVEKDPRSSDFGKFKVGNTRYDIGAGMNQIIRFFAQLMTAERKSTKTGKIIKLDGKGMFGQDRTDVIKQFARSKLSPVAGSVINMMVGKDMVGSDVTWKREALKNIIPLYIQDINSMYEKEGMTGVMTTAVPAFFGVGVQNYDNTKKKR